MNVDHLLNTKVVVLFEDEQFVGTLTKENGTWYRVTSLGELFRMNFLAEDVVSVERNQITLRDALKCP